MNEQIRTPRGGKDVARERLLAELAAGASREEWLEATLLRPAQVAWLLQVSRRSVTHWAGKGVLPSMRTPGGHRRFRAGDVLKLVEALTVQPRRPKG